MKITKRQLRRIIKEEKQEFLNESVPSRVGMEILSIKDALVDIKMGVRYHDEELAEDLALQIDRLLRLGYSVKEGKQVHEDVDLGWAGGATIKDYQGTNAGFIGFGPDLNEDPNTLHEDEESTVKYNANPALTGDQTTLPDKLQKGIIDKAEDEDEDETKNEGTSLENMPDAWRQVLGDCLGGTK